MQLLIALFETAVPGEYTLGGTAVKVNANDDLVKEAHRFADEHLCNQVFVLDGTGFIAKKSAHSDTRTRRTLLLTPAG